MIQKILVPVDLSIVSASVIRLAGDLARRTGAELILLHVFTPDEFADAHRDAGFTLDEYIGGLWSTMRDHLREAGGPMETRLEVLQGWSIPEQILTAASRHDAQLIIMGTHGRTGLRRLLLGSVAEEVLRHATCPVLVVPVLAEVRARVPVGTGAAG